MSSKLRDDNECQNCGYTVDKAYCSNCGQKNTETRQPFHHLFTHFIEDFTHYDGAFWKTIKHLLFRPGRLTKEYLQGKRQTYVPPVKLYIFISFVTFFFMSLTSASLNTEKVASYDVDEAANGGETYISTEREINIMGFKSLRELDSLQKYGPENRKLGTLEYKFAKGIFNAAHKGLDIQDFSDQFMKIAPKILFLYLPVFSFWLWLFHSKKRWYFFDHGIFTLHYFSLLLLLFTISLFLEIILVWLFGDSVGEPISNIVGGCTLLYSFIYFFMFHSRMYGENKIITVVKGITLFFINLCCIIVAIALATMYIIMNIH